MSRKPPRPCLEQSEEEPWVPRLQLPWHLAFAGMYVVSALAIVPSFRPGEWRADTWIAEGGLTFVAIAYCVFMVPPGIELGDRRVQAYLTCMVVGLSVATYGDSMSTVFLFVGFTHTWALTGSRRLGTRYSAALTLGFAVGLAFNIGGWYGALVATISGVLTFAFSVALGFSIISMVDRAQERSRLALDLAETRRELAESRWAEDLAAQRQSIAQEVHDTLAQGFTSIVMLAQVARRDAEGGHGAAAAERLALIEQTARENLGQARALVAASAPLELNDGGIAPALERLAQRFAAETDVAVTTDVEPMASNPGRDVVLLRACQEALANVRKHAQAHRVTVSLTKDGDECVLQVRDDGVGLGSHFAPGIGLESMTARAHGAGGSLTVRGSASGGTRLELRVPTSHDGYDGHAGDEAGDGGR